MRSELPKSFKEGDELTASLVNSILGEIWRWRAMEGVPPVHVSEANSGFGPPIISVSTDTVEGQFYPGTTGTTGGGYGAGTPASPAKPANNTVVIYGLETHSGTNGGWPSANSITINTTSAGSPQAFNVYATAISANLTAWYWKSPSSGNYYIITADCP